MGPARIASAGRRGFRAATDALSTGGLTVLLLGVVLSLMAGVLTMERERRDRDERVAAELERASEALPARLQRSEIVLRAAPGFAQTFEDMTASTWLKTVGRLNVRELAPAIRSVMLLEPLPRGGRTSVPMLPGANRAGARLRHVAPRTTSSGFLSPNRAAMDEVGRVLAATRDAGATLISAPVEFTGGGLPGTELFIAAPFYADDRPGSSVEARRERVRAWVGASVRVDAFIANALTGLDEDVALEITDRAAGDDVPVARFSQEGPIARDAFDDAATTTTTLLNRTWVVRATSTRALPWISWPATALCLLITAFVVAQLVTRRRAERRALALAADRTAALEVRTQELQHRTLHDALTGLANRVLVQDRLEHALRHRAPHRVAVLVIDLDRFKLANDSYGHQAGDALLVETARRLRAAVRPGDTPGRLGGDEFVLIAELEGDGDGAAQLAERVVAAFRAPMAVDGRDLVLTVSVGVAVGSGGAGADAEDLMHSADAAMYRVKRSGGNAFALFDATMHARALDRLQLESDLRAGIERGELVVHYQPTVEARTRRITGLEALVRWRRPDGIAAPGRFIEVAEDSGLIVPLGATVLDQALVQACRWREAGTPQRVWVNVSARQLARATFVDEVCAALERHGAPGSMLGLEVTESALLDDPEHARARLAALQRGGVAVAVDDFGTGYSSLERLKAFGLDVVKLDRSFVDGVNDDRYDRAIVEAVVRMAHGLDATLVAEGVETEEQAATLADLGCDTLQGYLFGRPAAADAIALGGEAPAGARR